MSIEASSFVLGLSMGRGNGIRKLILLGYANHADKSGRSAYPSSFSGLSDRMLHDDPPRLQLPPPAKAREGVAEKANGQWKRLADATEVVVHEWSSSDPDSRPTGEHAWTRIADVAALTQAAAVLDRQFVDADKAALRILDVCSEVELVADHARQHATSGPLPHPAPLQPRPQRLAPQLVRGLTDVPAGMAHLGTLITSAGHLRPSMIAALATAHGRSIDAIAAALTATAPPGQRAARDRVAAALRNHGQSLATVALACRTLESIEPDDPRPAMQMRELRTALNPLTDRPHLAAGNSNQQALHAALRPALGASLAIETTTQVAHPIRTLVHTRRRRTSPHLDQDRRRSPDPRGNRARPRARPRTDQQDPTTPNSGTQALPGAPRDPRPSAPPRTPIAVQPLRTPTGSVTATSPAR